MPDQYRVLLTGGGTGGHVYPCLAIYSYLKSHDLIEDAHYLGIRGRAEDKIIPRTGIPLSYIVSSPVAGGSPFQTLKALITIMRGTFQAFKHLRSFKPDLVIATGGYASAPVLFAAFLAKKLSGLKIIVEEQNLVPGLLNKVGSLLADVLLVNFKESIYFTWSKKAVYVGYPLREQYYSTAQDKKQSRKALGIPDDNFVILVTGGSLGARSINRVLVESLPELINFENLSIVHSVGMADTPEYNALEDTCNKLKEKLGENFDEERLVAYNKKNKVFYQAFPFIHRMFEYQKAADLIVSRAGAGALAEIAAVGVPSVIIPKRGLPGDHQELNAINMADRGCCSIIFEQSSGRNRADVVTLEEFLQQITSMITDQNKREDQAKNILKLHAGYTAQRIVSTIKNVLHEQPVNYIDEIIEPRFVKFQRLFDHLIVYLDEVKQQKDYDNPYLRFYSIKIQEYLNASDFLIINKGIKLIGPLQRIDLFDFIRDNFKKFKGFLRRNSLISLQKSDQYHPCFRELIEWGLSDSYYEVRREALVLARCFVENLKNSEYLHRVVRKLLHKRFVSFEVKAEAIKLAVLLYDQETFYTMVRPYLYSRNIRLREALLESIIIGLVKNRLTRDEPLKIFLKKMMITTSEFKPEFKIRENYLTVLRELEGTNNGYSHH